MSQYVKVLYVMPKLGVGRHERKSDRFSTSSEVKNSGRILAPFVRLCELLSCDMFLNSFQMNSDDGYVWGWFLADVRPSMLSSFVRMVGSSLLPDAFCLAAPPGSGLHEATVGSNDSDDDHAFFRLSGC